MGVPAFLKDENLSNIDLLFRRSPVIETNIESIAKFSIFFRANFWGRISTS